MEALSDGLTAEILEVMEKMGDRTFSADDVLRIYEFYLDETEMETVENFFRPEVPIELTLLERVLEAFLLARSLLSAPAIVFALQIFPQVAINAYQQAIFELNRGSRAIDNAIRSIDA